MGNKDFVQIKKVLASAGGGKTTKLSKEFISILKNKPDRLDEILAITFTNKAANEMKQRILSILKDNAIRKNDKIAEKIVDSIIENFSDFSVKTIDSFTYSIIRAFQYELGINLETEVQIDKEKYFRMGFERMIEKTMSDFKIKDFFIKFGIYYLETGSSIRFWESLFDKLSRMLENILNQSIELINIDKIDEDRKNLFFSYCLHNLIFKFKECIEEIEKEENIILIKRFGDYIGKLYEITSGYIPFIYYKIGSRFKHILIDEFQDTSIIEWKNILPIVENILSEGGTLFYVGDPKQSIYQWRGGTPELFDKVIENFSNYKHKIEKLDVNYRSRENIINFVIDIFKMEEIEDIVKDVKLPLKYFKEVEQKIAKGKENTGYVVIKKKKEEEITNSIIEELKEIIKRYNYSDIAILVRKNSQVRDIVRILSVNGIPYSTRDNLSITENSIVRDILSLLKFFNTPSDDLSFLNFITGNCFCKITGIKKEHILDKILNYSGYLYNYFKDIFNKEWELFIKPYFDRFGYTPVYDIVVEFIRDYKIYENFKDEIAFVEGFLEYIYKLKDYSNDINYILENINNENIEIKQGSSTNSVLVSTIHSVKGLEFPVVFLPNLKYTLLKHAIHKEFFIGEKKKLYVRYEDNKKDKEIKDKFDIEIIEEYQKILENKFIEELNLLYVALTRAKDEIYIYYTKTEKTGKVKGSSVGLEKLWNVIFNMYMEKKGKEDLIIGSPLSSDSKIEEYKYFYPERKSCYYDLLNSTIFKRIEKHIEDEKIGEAFHKLIAEFDRINNDIVLKTEAVLNSMFPKYKKEYYKEKIMIILKNLLEWEEALNILNGKVVMNEKWGYDKDGLLRIDRIVIDEDLIKIVDFKTGNEKKEDIKQIERYKRFIKSLYSDKEVKGYIIYLSLRKIKEV